jgi:hypothetical protein
MPCLRSVLLHEAHCLGLVTCADVVTRGFRRLLLYLRSSMVRLQGL